MKRMLGAALVVAIVAIAAASAQAALPLTVGKIADEWGTIQAAGARGPTGGNRNWNIEGSAAGSFASTGTLRFYMQDVVSQFDAQFGVGNWTVNNVRIVFEHDDAGFSAAGNVDVYHFTDDALAITNGADTTTDALPGEFGSLTPSPLLYDAAANYLETKTAGSTDPATIFGTVTQVDSYNFSLEGDDDLDVLGDVLSPLNVSSVTDAAPTYGISLGAGVGDTNALMDSELAADGSALDIATLAADIESGTDALSLILVGDATVAATYKGNPFGTLYPPRIYISAVPEPATMLLLGMGGLMVLRRRRA